MADALNGRCVWDVNERRRQIHHTDWGEKSDDKFNINSLIVSFHNEMTPSMINKNVVLFIHFMAHHESSLQG